MLPTKTPSCFYMLLTLYLRERVGVRGQQKDYINKGHPLIRSCRPPSPVGRRLVVGWVKPNKNYLSEIDSSGVNDAANQDKGLGSNDNQASFVILSKAKYLNFLRVTNRFFGTLCLRMTYLLHFVSTCWVLK